MNLIIDVGNTLVKAAVFDGPEIIYLNAYKELDKKEIQLILTNYPDIESCILGSVRESYNDIDKFIPENINLHILSPDTPLPITHKYETFETLGVDRIAAVVAAQHMHPGKNILVVETGTCVTYDFIDAKGVYHGGSISPGINIRFQALHNFTARLPLVDAVKVAKLTGNSTVSSIQSGVINGIIAEFEGIVSRYESDYENLTIILSGGDREYFDKNLKNNIFAVPNIVLTGLNIILNFNDKD